MDQKLRNMTTMPVALASVPDYAPTAEVAAAVEQFENAKTAALVSVAAEKQVPVVIPEKKE